MSDPRYADEIARGAAMTPDEALEEVLRLGDAWGIGREAAASASAR